MQTPAPGNDGQGSARRPWSRVLRRRSNRRPCHVGWNLLLQALLPDVPHFSGGLSRRFVWRAFGLVEGGQGSGFDVSDDVAYAPCVVEPGLVTVGLVLGEGACHGLAGDGAGPVQVRAVQGRRVCLAPAVVLAAAHEPARESAG